MISSRYFRIVAELLSISDWSRWLWGRFGGCRRWSEFMMWLGREASGGSSGNSQYGCLSAWSDSDRKRSVSIAGFDAGFVHLFFYAAVAEKVILDFLYHLVEHGYCLMDEGEHEIAVFLIAHFLNQRREVVRRIMAAAKFQQAGIPLIASLPERKAPCAHIVLIVGE